MIIDELAGKNGLVDNAKKEDKKDAPQEVESTEKKRKVFGRK
jgi:hypothetical protein